MTKICSKCKLEKTADLKAFGPNKHTRDSLTHACRDCMRKRDKKAPKKRKPIKKSIKENHKFCRVCDLEKSFSEFRKQKGSLYYKCNQCESAEKKLKFETNPNKYLEISRKSNKKRRDLYGEQMNTKQRQRYQEDKEYRNKQLNIGKTYRQSDDYKQYREERGKPYMRQYYHEKIKTNPILKLQRIVRSRIHSALKSKNFNKKYSIEEYLGCTVEFLKSYLETKFQSNMTWENHGYGSDKWNVDHIIPLSSATTAEEVYKLCHYTNLQPLWQPDNFTKSDKIDGIAFRSTK